jgi:hypothetical protein
MRDSDVSGVAPVSTVLFVMERFGKLPVPPWPDAQAFSRTVRLAVSITRDPPVSAQRNGSMVCIVAQLRKLPLHWPLQVRVAEAMATG